MDVGQLFSVRDKVVVVTGGSRGIGEMIARGFVAAGARVYISSRSVEACQALAGELSDTGSCIALPADLSTTEGVKQLAGQLAEREDRIHVLVNNAGATWGAPLDEYPESGYDKVMDLNVRSVFLLTQALAPRLRAAASPQDPARVINIGSIDGGFHVPTFESYAYSASKAAVHQLSRHLAKFLARDHVTVNAIAPGLFPSKMTKVIMAHEEEVAAAIPLGRVGQPEDMAGIAIYLASRAGAYTTGAVIPVDGGHATLA
ncbi:SDR family oxidoreductase [Egicoccus sp. AB-alg6-2]|uniref:SDR family oxidoreductase n=1 Tax=Egicoccus sp. AB-alg6-2 TaxID=3242692 RepID=UPI00359D8F81